MRTHSSIKARPDGQMGRRRDHPFRWVWWGHLFDPELTEKIPKAVWENRATSGVRQALKRSSNAKRRRRDREYKVWAE